MNIDFTKDNYRFNARASAIIYNKDKTKVLLSKIEGNDYYLLPGGRIEMYEDSLSSIKREIQEELGFNLEYELCSINENFFERNNIKITQYEFCFKSIYDGTINDNRFVCKDNNNQFFYWIDIDKIDDYKILPNSAYKLIIDSQKTIKHMVEK